MALTAKQEAFCLALLESGNAKEAYRKAYPASSSWLDSTVYEKACRLRKNAKIMARMEQLRKPAIEAAQMTLEGHLNDLKRLRDKAEDEGKYTAAVQAEVSRGKAAGLYVEKFDITHRLGEMSDEEIRLEIASLAIAKI